MKKQSSNSIDINTLIAHAIFLGSVVYLICSIPIVVLVFKGDRKSVPIILVSSMILGAISGFIMQTLFL